MRVSACRIPHAEGFPGRAGARPNVLFQGGMGFGLAYRPKNWVALSGEVRLSLADSVEPTVPGDGIAEFRLYTTVYPF